MGAQKSWPNIEVEVQAQDVHPVASRLGRGDVSVNIWWIRKIQGGEEEYGINER
ncbi:hypothetical protein M569_17543 [Genlisea aurea]|uniref:Uncharacterized protein n=1 Tax=Genlisea aurea TaxID=192259 RepID=S8DD65_9LAMI|nr:hypothetical protein M569_17543 [Genlisea aurea]